MKTRIDKSRTTAARAIDPHRRRLLQLIAGGAGGATLLAVMPWTRAFGADAAGNATKTAAQKIPIVVFDDQGKSVGERMLDKIVKSAAEWKQQLSPAAYQVLRQDGTESPYSGDYDKPDEPGIYRCLGCETALYDADTQFHSGTGWPSFWAPIASENVAESTDTTFGMQRTEISCARCDGHLGHVFTDGPKPTGLRYCMNAVAMRFVPASKA